MFCESPPPPHNLASVILKSTRLRSKVSSGHFLLTFAQKNLPSVHMMGRGGLVCDIYHMEIPRVSLEALKALEGSAPPISFITEAPLPPSSFW